MAGLNKIQAHTIRCDAAEDPEEADFDRAWHSGTFLMSGGRHITHLQEQQEGHSGEPQSVGKLWTKSSSKPFLATRKETKSYEEKPKSSWWPVAGGTSQGLTFHH